jgi:hypothetical protein
MNKATEFLERVVRDKVDLAPKDFKVIVDDNVLPITPEMVAEMFACMGSDEQAAFYNHVDKVASSWHGGRGQLCMQLQAITDEDGLTLAGRRVMQQIGDYSHWGLVPKADWSFLDKIND